MCSIYIIKQLCCRCSNFSLVQQILPKMKAKKFRKYEFFRKISYIVQILVVISEINEHIAPIN
ncbi:MAG: hypothetical protein LBI20_02140 [Holosporales bacterium]|nr:hypothetical protein [Holosporales bacterium]